MRIIPTSSPWAMRAVLAAASLSVVVGLEHPVRAADEAGQEPSRAAEPRPSLAVTLVSPQAADWPREIEASGGLFAWQEGVIAAETGGLRVVAVAVDVGDRVRRGQELARLAQETVKAELAQQEAKVAQARASLAEARANADRARTVKDRGAMPEQQRTQYLLGEEAAQANLAAAEAARDMERIRLEQTHILAVDDGVITARSVTLGTVVQPGTELFRIVRQGRVEWRAEVTAAQLAQVVPGQEAALALPGGEQVAGRVRIAAPTLDTNTRYGLVYVDIPPDSPARPGMFARGSIRLGVTAALSLPESAVVLRDGNSFSFEVLADGRVAQRKLETGRRAQGRVEILGGLTPDAQVAASGGAFLNDGDRVRVEPAPAAAAADGLTLLPPDSVSTLTSTPQ